MSRVLVLFVALTACPASTTPTPAPATKTQSTQRPAEPARPAPPIVADAAPKTPSHPLCDAAAAQLQALRAGPRDAAIAYSGSPVQAWIQASDAEIGRKDDPAIVAALADTSPAGNTYSKALIEAALAQWMRHQLKRAAEGKDARDAAWTAAACAWRLALRTADDPASDEIDAAFQAGAAAFAGPDPDRVVLPTRQTIEKTWYRIAHRRLLAAATDAHEKGDAVAAALARGTFEALRDRMQDKNTPGILVVTTNLGAADPHAVDPDKVERELAVALVKRARKYCSEAVDPAFGKPLGAPPALATVAEGLAFTRILLPDMTRRLAAEGFNEAAHLQAWQGYQDAVTEADAADARTHSEQLVHWNCAYQRALGIRECTSTVDEVAPSP